MPPPRRRTPDRRSLIPLEHLLLGAWLATITLSWTVQFAVARQRWYVDVAEILVALTLFVLAITRRAGGGDLVLRAALLTVSLVGFLYVEPFSLGLAPVGSQNAALTARHVSGIVDALKVLFLGLAFARTWR